MKKLYKKWLGKALLALALIAPATMQAKTVYFENSENWSTVKVYPYGSGYTVPGWPGNVMTKIGDTNFYSAEVGDASYVIFNNDNGTQTKGDNYDNSSVKDGYLYRLDGRDNGVFKLTSLPMYPTDLYLYGGPGGWDTSNALKYSEKSGNVFTFNNVEFTNERSFRFICDTNGSGHYGSESDANVMSVGSTLNMKYGWHNCWQVPEAGAYNIVVDFDNRTVTLKNAYPDMYLCYKENDQQQKVKMDRLGDVYYIRNHKMPKNGTNGNTDKQMCFFQFEDSEGNVYHTTNSTDNFWFNKKGAQDKCATTGEKIWAANGDMNWNITINPTANKVTAEPYNNGEYYLVGDCNKWLNDGSYQVNGKDIPYGYVSYKDGNKVYGDKEDWKFTESTSQKYLATEGWLSVSIAKLWGQFTIYNGPFKKENGTDKDNVVDWSNEVRGQWSHEQPRTENDADNKPVNPNYFNKPLTTESAMNLRLGSRGNAYIDRNFYENATLYFNPILGQVALEGTAKDINFYYHNNADTQGTEGLTLLINAESMNTENYSIGGTEYNKTEDGKYHVPLTFVEGSIKDSESGITYDHYWTCKIPNGLESPAGQLFTVSVENAKGVSSDYWVTVQGNNVKILDSVKVFVEIPSNNKSDIKSISYRVYGYGKDGAGVKVLDGHDETEATAQDNTGWITLERGSYTNNQSPAFGSLNHTWVADNAASKAPRKAASQTENIVAYSHSTKEIHNANAFKFVQFKIEYNDYVVPDPEAGENASYGAVTHYVPDTFLTERPEREAYMTDPTNVNQGEEPSWVLYGNHKVYRGAGVTTGVKNIEAEAAEDLNAPEEFYNLQGIRVAEPTHGIFIKRQGKKVTKVIL